MITYRIHNKSELISTRNQLVSLINHHSSLEIHGVISVKSTNGYSDIYYDKVEIPAIEENDTPYYLDVIIPAKYHHICKVGDVVECKCAIWMNDRMQIVPRVSYMEIVGSVVSNLTNSDECCGQDQRKEKFFKEMLNKCLKGEKPKICLVFPNGSIANKDVERSLGDARKSFDFVVVKHSFYADYLERLLKRLDDEGYDAIAVIRGGGSLNDLTSQFNLPSLLDVWTKMKTTTISAIGHEADNLPMHRFRRKADISFGTPSLLGTYFEKINSSKENIEIRNKIIGFVIVVVILCGIWVYKHFS